MLDSEAGVFRYSAFGIYQNESFTLAGTNEEARGITTDGVDLFVVDKDVDRVFRYSTSGTLLGSFNANPVKDPRGITTDGTYIWVVDRNTEAVHRFGMEGSPTPTLAGQTGFAIIIDQIFTTPLLSDILVRWAVSEDTDQRDRTVAIYEGKPFGTQTGDLTADPLTVGGLVAIASTDRKTPVLSALSRDVLTGAHTAYFFNDSDNDIVTRSTETSCVCVLQP